MTIKQEPVRVDQSKQIREMERNALERQRLAMLSDPQQVQTEREQAEMELELEQEQMSLDAAKDLMEQERQRNEAMEEEVPNPPKKKKRRAM